MQYNGIKASWSNFSISIRGDDVSIDPEDFVSLKWGDKLTPGDVPGRGSAFIGTTEGEYSAEATLTILVEGKRVLMQALRDANTAGKAGLTQFDIYARWEPASGNADELRTVELRSCRVMERNTEMSKGADAAQTEIPLHVMRLFEDGVCLIGDE